MASSDGQAAYVEVGGLKVERCVHDFICEDLLGALSIDSDELFSGFGRVVARVAPRNRELLAKRASLQKQLDEWHAAEGNFERAVAGAPEYRQFLEDIGYLLPFGDDDVKACATGVDAEMLTPGVQLVVPGDNARFALNAANARYVSLLDALYGTDAICDPDAPDVGIASGGGYNAKRGQRVFAFVYDFLNGTFPLADGAKHEDVIRFEVRDGRLRCVSKDGSESGLADASQFRAYLPGGGSTAAAVEQLALCHRGLHVLLRFDASDGVGQSQASGLCDVKCEAALTAICDFEDSVAAVDGADKARLYRTWAGLMRGDLASTFEKKGRTVERRLERDLRLLSPGGDPVFLRRRALLLCRNVGMHMYTDAVLDADGREVPEAFLDLLVTALCGHLDLRKGGGAEELRNSLCGSVVVVKPKMHGAEEVSFNAQLFAAMEELAGLAPRTLKMGVMDEERRTTCNLPAALAACADRVVFANTGFLDRTGSEMNAVSSLGPVLGKQLMRAAPWLRGYEDGNVDACRRLALERTGQIGKGMWAQPDAMRRLLETKGAQLKAGATTAWVPSPTAAAIHSLHYFAIDAKRHLADLPPGAWQAADPKVHADLLKAPVAAPRSAPLPAMVEALGGSEAVRREVDAAAQAVLGYVARWVQHGIGCSKVPDLDGVALMEDRATLRINAQMLANWMAHGVLQEGDLRSTFLRMAALVDAQNAADANYEAMVEGGAPAPDGAKGRIAYDTAIALILDGVDLDGGYVEPRLHGGRRRVKALAAQ